MRTVITLLAACLFMMLVGALSTLAGTLPDKEVFPINDAITRQALEEVTVPFVKSESTLPTFSPRGEALVERMKAGFLKRINSESPKWYECGILTPEGDKILRAEKIARYNLDAIRKYDLRWLNPWGVLAVMYSESRGDECAIGPNSRHAARDLKLVDPEKPFNQWTKNDVVTLLNHPKWRKSRATIGADLGLGQQVWERYARILDAGGNEFCGSKQLRCRVPTLDEILSVENGPRVVATGMLTRSKWYRTIRPWQHWPGSIKNYAYDMKITALIYSLGGKDDEKAVF